MASAVCKTARPLEWPPLHRRRAPGAGLLGLLIAVVATGAGMVGPVLSYELLERQSEAPGRLLRSWANKLQPAILERHLDR